MNNFFSVPPVDTSVQLCFSSSGRPMSVNSSFDSGPQMAPQSRGRGVMGQHSLQPGFTRDNSFDSRQAIHLDKRNSCPRL